MTVFLTDAEIGRFIKEPKTLSADIFDIGKMKLRGKTRYREMDIARSDGSKFVIRLRCASLDITNFSVMLSYVPSQSNEVKCTPIIGQ